ncbi:MAG: PepSY-associated TM helix domain-containing protein, partial [Nevskiales bacterium]
LLNHGPDLGFDRQTIRADWLLRAYGITPESPEYGFPVAGHWVAQAGDQLFLDTRPVAELRGKLIGAAALPGVILAAAPDAALLFTHEGELIESLGPEALPGTVLAVASSGQHLLIRTPDGLYASGAELLGFEAYAGDWPTGAGKALPLPVEIAQGIVATGGGVKLSQERVLADLHSGRLFGRYGPWVMDLAALGFMILAVTGLWLWWRYRRTRRLRVRQRPH